MSIDLTIKHMEFEELNREIKRTMRRSARDAVQLGYMLRRMNDGLIGYLSYIVNFYSDCAYNFCLMSFDRGNPVVGKDLFEKMEELVNRFHRVEWRMVGDNPVERHYDKFCKMHNGKKFVLTDCIKDSDGNYRNSIIYEIVKE